MGPKIKPHHPMQTYLIPVRPSDWLPKKHFAYFVYQTLKMLDDNGELKAFSQKYDKRHAAGSSAYSYFMLLSVIIYAYSKGIFSSRQIATALYEDVGLRFLSAGSFPSYRTISRFRKENFNNFRSLFVIILECARGAKRTEFADIAIDGTKIKANASKLKNRKTSEEDPTEQAFKKVAEDILHQAEATDAREDKERGGSKEEEEKTSEELECEAQEEKDRARKTYEAIKRRKKRQKESPPDKPQDVSQSKQEAPQDEEKRAPESAEKTRKKKTKITNTTDPDSRLMKTSGEGFQQSYNAQIAVDKESHLILANKVSQSHNDQGELLPMLDEASKNTGRVPKTVLADAGYANEKDLSELEKRETEGYIATRKFKHTEKPGPSRKINPKNAATLRMSQKLSTPHGRAKYRERAWIAEAPFGWIKRCRKFRQFSVRGLESVQGEFALVCLTQNLTKMFAFEGK